jgi:hypothetical protein
MCFSTEDEQSFLDDITTYLISTTPLTLKLIIHLAVTIDKLTWESEHE